MTAIDSDAALVEQARTDEASFRELYERHVPGLYRYAYYRTGNRQDAEDVVAQAFLRIWRGLPGYRNLGIPFSHWAYRIAANVVASRPARRELPTAEVRETLPGGVAAVGPGPDPALHSAAERDNLAALLRALPERQQQVLTLRYVLDLPVRDVAVILGRSENAVKQLAFRALTSLRRRMSPDA